MEYEYIIYFNNSTSSNLELLYDLDRELQSFGIENELNVNKANRIKTFFQGKQYDITFRSYKNFSQTLLIKTDEKYSLENRIGLITLIWRLLNWRFGVDYGQMEVLKKESFHLINERFEDRFIDQAKLHSLLEREYKPIDFEFIKQGNVEYEITKGQIYLDDVDSEDDQNDKPIEENGVDPNDEILPNDPDRNLPFEIGAIDGPNQQREEGEDGEGEEYFFTFFERLVVEE